MTRPSTTVVIGVGNTQRRDDGVGIMVVRQLQERVPPGVTTIEESGEGVSLLDAWKGAATVLLVDAVHSAAPPGTIHRLDAHVEPIPNGFFHCSTHAFGVAEAVELARALNQLPPRLVMYGIEGKSFAAGMELSEEVERAAAVVIAQVLDAIWVFAEPCLSKSGVKDENEGGPWAW